MNARDPDIPNTPDANEPGAGEVFAPPPAELLDSHPALGRDNILLVWRGSVAHGTYVPSTDPDSIDDKDLIGVAVPPLDYYIGNGKFGSRGTVEVMDDPWDVVVYEARKAIDLLERCNPNVLAILWADPAMRINVSPAGQMLIDNREMFSTRRAFETFRGYAESQVGKALGPGSDLGYKGTVRQRLRAERGYDAKSASHAVRLLRGGVEFLREGRFDVMRADSDELTAIKSGQWALPDIQAEIARLLTQLEQAHADSPLPATPDREAVNALTMAVIGEALELPKTRDRGTPLI